jgi:DNA-binding FadR family transcriptional regulator
VNRHTLRVAVATLVSEGLLEVSHGISTRVRDWTREGSMNLLGTVLMMQQGTAAAEKDMRHTLELRRLVYRGVPEMLCAPGTAYQPRGYEICSLHMMFRYGDQRTVEVLRAEERLLVELVDRSGNIALSLLAHTVRRALDLVARNGAADVSTSDFSPQLDALELALAERRQADAETLLDQLCRAREPQYLALAAGPPYPDQAPEAPSPDAGQPLPEGDGNPDDPH